MFDIEIPRDPNDAPTHASLARLWLTHPEHQIVRKVSDDLGTSMQTSLALLHEGHRKWEAVCEALECGVVGSRASAGAKDVPARVAHTVSYFCGTVAADVPTIDPLVVMYSTPLPPEAFGEDRIRIESQLRDEVRQSCALGFAVLAFEHLQEPVGIVTMERGFVEVPFPFVPRFFELEIDARVGELLDASVLDSPDAFRHGLEF